MPSAGACRRAGGRSRTEGTDASVVEVLVPLGRNGADRPGIRVLRSRHFASRVHPTAWPPVTTAPHTALDLALGHGPDRAVA